LIVREMFKTAVVAAAVGSAAALSKPNNYYEAKFFDWMKEHNKVFASGDEFAQRLAIFSDNVDFIEAHNAAKSTYQLGTNEFSHLSHEEFLDVMHIGSLRPPLLRRGSEQVLMPPKDVSANPASVDWTTVPNVVTPIKNQGNCGSCWAFSAVSAIEGAYGIKYNSQAHPQGLSEQHLVSCDTVNAGCNGGWMDDAFNFVKKNGGIATEGDYVYTSGTTGQTGTCQKTHTNIPNSAPKSYTDVTPGSVSALETAVAKQPVSIAIQANQRAFQSYKSGVITSGCGQRLDHGVAAVGYGIYTDGTPYWKVRNSWGTTWGDKGYVLIEKSNADVCGVLDAASYPNL